MAETLETAGLWKMKEYIRRRQYTIKEYIPNHPIYKLCTGAERMSGLSRLMQWWDKEITREEEGNNASEGTEREVGRHGENFRLKYLYCNIFFLT